MRHLSRKLLTATALLAFVAASCGSDSATTQSTAPPGTTGAPATSGSETTASAAPGSSGGTSSSPLDTTAATSGPSEPGSTAPSGELTKVNLACVAGVTGIPLDYAIKNGLDKKNGIQLECVQVQTGPQLSAAMLSGDINVSGFNPANIFPLLDGGVDVVGFQPVLDHEYFDIIVRKDFPLPHASEGWKGVMKDLSGHNIGVVAKGAAAEDIARGLFPLAGEDPDGATYIATGLTNTTLAAMTNGQIDAALVFEPGVTIALEQGIATQPFSISEGTGPPEMDWASLFYTSTRDYATKHPEAIKGVQAAYLEGLAWMTDPANKDAVIAEAMSYMNLDKQTATDLITRDVPLFSKDTTLKADRYDQVGDFFFKIGKTKKAYHVADYAIDVSKL